MSKRKGIIIAAVVLVGVALALGFYWPFGGRSGELQLHGIVEIQEVRLGSKIGGRVEKVHVKEGAVVEAGDLLVEFEAPELQAQKKELQADLRKAKADLKKTYETLPRDIEAAKAAAEGSKAKWEKIKEGWRSEEIEMTRFDFNTAKADLDLAKLEKERQVKLYAKDSAAKGELDAALTNLKRAESKYASAKIKLEMVEKGGWILDREMAEKEWQQADTNYKKLVATEYDTKQQAQETVNSLEAKLEKLEVDLKEARVCAKERSVVEVISVRPGDVVAPNQPVVRVLRADDLWVKVFVSEIDVGKLRLNQDVHVNIDAYPGKTFDGKVIQVGTIAEFTPRNVQSKEERHYQVFPVKIAVDAPGILKAGMAADVIVPAAP